MRVAQPRTVILTDGTVLFDRDDFPGRELVEILPLDIVIDGEVQTPGDDEALSLRVLPEVVGLARRVQLLSPPPQAIRMRLRALAHRYCDVVVMTSGDGLTSVFSHALEASAGTLHRLHLQVWDSQTMGFSLGWAVQEAAAMATQGASAREIITHLRRIRNSFYTVIAVQSLSYLHESRLLDPAQALVGELLGMTPLFLLEDGGLLPLYKARSSRHLLDLLVEFAEEFAHVRRVAVMAGEPMCDEGKALRQRLSEVFPDLTIPCLPQAATLQALFGPRVLALFIQE
ncbi:MAG TPA: DegV family EDD domain-containing protein [Anaerolineae bacterium]|nr:DegV family EDD domain-containing protein [Anaerolineae bacterium]HID85396.1 DegV family EDD domain-containing protein [Anaerolineales bacterium]HIQ09394.1 DegV family EDD domain-containing protein [Anaerolineaceae bacterium]